jgi:hypothetical protein
MKRTCDVLQRELESHTKSLEGLAKEVTQRKRELETTLGSLRVAVTTLLTTPSLQALAEHAFGTPDPWALLDP